jgi:prepilin-type N-terminal cleavage/methylation domain-containing protein
MNFFRDDQGAGGFFLRPVRKRLDSAEGPRLQQTRWERLQRESRAGVTLLEMLIVVAIIAILASISFPSLISGLAGIRLSSSAGDVASFFTSSMNRVERREQAAAIVVEPAKNRIVVFTAISGDKPASELNLPPGILIDAQDSARYMIYPGGAFPRISLILKNEKGARRRISIDPVTAVPKIERVEVTP